MLIWFVLFILSFGAGLLVNYFCDFLIDTRFVDVDPDEIDPDEMLCEACVRPKPMLEYFLISPACGSCGRFRWRILLVYFFMIGLTFWLWSSQTELVDFLVGMVLLIYFGVVTIIDAEHRLILHPVSLVGAGLGLAFGIWQRGLISTLLGGVAGFGIMLGLFMLGGVFARFMARMRGQTIDEVALGFGDVNLAGVLGLMLGWPGIIAGLMLAILLGGFFSLFHILWHVILRKYRAFAAIPYGPFLVIGAVFLLFFRDALLVVLR